MGEVIRVGFGAAGDEDARVEVPIVVLLTLVLELSEVDAGALLGEMLLDETAAEEVEVDAGLLVDTDDEVVEEVAARDEDVMISEDDRLEDRAPHLPNPFWQLPPQ
jgi:hypothetical protein